MEQDARAGGLTAAAGVLMVLVLLWSGGLAAGFGYAALNGSGRSSSAQSLGYLAVAFFLALLAARTGYELVRRLAARHRAGRT